jgi:hypothetical protein
MAVVSLEDDPDNAERLRAVGLGGSLANTTEDVVRRSGCYTVDKGSYLKLRIRIRAIWDVPKGIGGILGTASERIISFDVTLSLIGGSTLSQANGYGLAFVRQMPGAEPEVVVRKADGSIAGNSLITAYNVALIDSLQGALGALVARDLR